ncbi:MAG: T9SS type A sorting domain-containing protein [Bacteroidota bacterium]
MVDSIEITTPEKTTIGEIIGTTNAKNFQTGTYSVSNQANYLFHWNVEGGNVVSGQGTNVVDIQWGAGASGLIKSVAESDLGCFSDTASLSISIVSTGISSKVAREFRIYPNPTASEITIEANASGEYTLQLTKLNGQLLLEKEIADPTYILDLSPFARGIYFINIKSEDHVSTRKIVKL